ncbi:MAG: hypothetical protein WAL30_02240 [Candidatus Aquirickettsiella sp.]
MKQNTFLFAPGPNLLADIDRLLNFIREPLPLDKFFEVFPNSILEAILGDLEFNLENCDCTEYFIIKLKDTDKAKLTNKDLDSFGITITDPIQFVNPLIGYKKDSPNLKLKDALINFITVNNNKINQIIINNTLDILKNTVLNHTDNKNKQIEINIFFNFLKLLILQDSVCNFNSITAKFLLVTANDLATLELQLPDIKTIISEIHIKLNITADKLSVPKILLAYEKLLYRTTIIFPTVKKSESKIHSLIDILIRSETINPLIISNYNFFKLSYFGQKGFRYIFGDETDVNLYEVIRRNCEYFSFFKHQYLEIINLIQELYILTDNNQKVINLSKQLTHLTDTYFQTLLALNSNAKEDLKNEKKNAYTEFQIRAMKIITEFREKNVLSLDRINILYKILNIIARLIPNFILQKKTRIYFFQKFTPQNRIIEKLEKTTQTFQPKL